MIKKIIRLLMLLIGLVGFVFPGFSEPASDKRPKFSLDDMGKLTAEIGKLRELDFKSPVKAGFKTKDELKTKLTADFNEKLPDDKLIKVQKTLIKMGLIPKNTDLKKLLFDVLMEQIGGFYDPKDKELYLIERNEDEKIPEGAESIEKNFGIPFEYTLAVHELTHALQDQYFDLQTLPTDSNNDDLAKAVTSIFEGEATFMMYDYLFRRAGLDISQLPDINELTGSTPAAGGKVLDKAPAYIREGLLFPYLKGLGFIHQIKAKEGWAAITKLYDKLPASTEQILHPQKYFGEDPDYPTEVTLPDFTKILPKEEWEFLSDSTLGELNTGVLLREFVPSLGTKQIAEGWDGDLLVCYENKKSGEIIAIWFLTWDTAKDATEFTEAYTKIINKKYSPYKITKQDKDKNQITWAKDETIIYLTQNDKNVIVMETVPKNLFTPLLESISKDTKCSELKEVKRIEREKPKK